MPTFYFVTEGEAGKLYAYDDKQAAMQKAALAVERAPFPEHSVQIYRVEAKTLNRAALILSPSLGFNVFLDCTSHEGATIVRL